MIVDRFDRDGRYRIGFVSALTMLEESDGQTRSYLDIAEIIERYSERALADLQQLFRRIVFSVLIGNTDDHLRNHGFLRRGRGWILAPAYDVNPNPDRPDRLSTTIDFADAKASLELALSVADYFRLSLEEAKSVITDVEKATRSWRQDARHLGLSEQEVDLMSVAFDSDQRRVARSLTGTLSR